MSRPEELESFVTACSRPPQLSMIERYSLASELTAPKLAASTPEVLGEGYWLNERLFFHVRDQMSSCGLLAGIPCLTDAVDRATKVLFSLEDLTELLSAHTRRDLRVQSLCDAEFEMPDAEHLAVRVKQLWYVIDLRSGAVADEAPAIGMPALYSPNGAHACVVKGSDLWLRNLVTGVERPLTTDGLTDCFYGREPDTCLSAISYREHPYPVGLWSPDSAWLLTHRIDQRAVPDIPLVQYATEEGKRPVLHQLKYAVPGDPLPIATLIAIHVDSGEVVVFEDLPDLVRVDSPFTGHAIWFTGGRLACLIRFDRYFKQVELFEIDLETGVTRCLLSEAAAAGYLELNIIYGATPNVRILADSQEIIWYSERDGWGQLYLYDSATGRLKNRITAGNGLVRDIVHVDQQRRRVLFLASGLEPAADPARRSLCSIGLDGQDFKVLLGHDGDLCVPITQPWGQDQSRRFRPAAAAAGISPDGVFAAVKRTSLRRGNRAEIVELSTGRGLVIGEVKPAEGESLPEEFTAVAMDGTTRLHGALFLPPEFDPTKRYPLVDYIYPGPQVAHKPQAYRCAVAGPAYSLAALGFVALMLDTRGAPIGSTSFHQCGYPSLKEPQLADHAAVVRQLCERHSFLDSARVGVMGYSGGGSATVKALCDYPDVYRVGVSASGEHDPSLYTSFWSDKYAGPVGTEAAAAHRTWVNAKRLKGKLLLIAADMDENVLINQTVSLIKGLIEANRNFDLILIPNGNHGVFIGNGYVQRRIWDYLVGNLLGQAAPEPDAFALEFRPHELDRMLKQLLR